MRFGGMKKACIYESLGIIVPKIITEKKFEKYSRNQLHVVVAKIFVSDNPLLFIETSIESEISNT